MYFITPSKPGIFLIGIRENRLYGFGEKNKKLCIYHKSIFDSGDWEKFCVININAVKAECCENGLHVAAGINKTMIMIAARDKKLTRVFSINIITKQLFTCKILYDDDEEITPRHLNLCSNCLMPVIRPVSFFLGIFCFFITPRRFKKDTEMCQYDLIISSRLGTISKRDSISFDHNPSSSIAINLDDRVLSVYGRSKGDGRIKTLIVNDDDNERILSIPVNDIDSVWHDMTFYSGSFGKTFALTRRKNAHNVTLRLYLIQYPELDIIDMTSFQFIASYTVDVNFPAFESSPFLLSYHNDVLKPDFIIFQTSVGIVTVPLRMLSLSKLAYLSLQRIPEPPLPPEVKPSIFQRIRNLLRRKPKKVTDPWMSLNFIKKTLGLSNNFQLR